MSTYTPPPRSQPPPVVAGPARTAVPPSRWTAGRIVAAIFGTLLLLASFGLGTAGAAVALADNATRDAGGYLMSDPVALSSGGYALTSTELEIQGANQLPHRILGDAKVTAVPTGDADVFVGVAPTSAAREYLAGVQRSEVTGFTEDPILTQRDGTAPGTAPTDTDIWVTEASGPGEQTITWPVENGSWTVVVMNADGSRGVSADVATGATVPALEWVYAALFGTAGVCLLLGVILLLTTIRRPKG